MFRSPTINRELTLNLTKIKFMLQHSVKLCRYVLCGCVAACCSTECFNTNIILARFSASSLMMVEDRNM